MVPVASEPVYVWLGLNPGPPGVTAQPRQWAPCHPLSRGAMLGIGFAEGAGTSAGTASLSYSEWPLLPSWPAALAQASSLPGTFWKRLAV